jgi:cytochrome c
MTRRFTLLFLCLVAWSVIHSQNRVLVFSKTASFRHSSIGPGKVALLKLAAEKGFAVDTTESATAFTEKNLQRYRCVIWLSTTGNVLDAFQQNAFERYIQAGGGYLGIHAASDTEYEWAWYGKLMGGWFDNHPSQPSNVQEGTFHITDTQHPLTSFLPEPWVRKDEFYAYKKVEQHVKTLITIDEKSYVGGTMGDYHPMAWYHEYDGGRAFYTNMGHTDETFSEPLVMQHIWAGLEWTMAGPALDYNKVRTAVLPEENRFTKVVLAEKLDEPMELALLPGNKVLFIQRKGEIMLYDPKTEQTTQIAAIPVSTKYIRKDTAAVADEAEDGLLGLTLDPNFEKNHWLYLYYSPAGDAAKNILARYEMRGDQLLMDTKKVLLEVPVQRDECCHTGGSLDWDAKGNLYLSTGDNTSPRADGYAPIDHTPGRAPWDALKSSGNTNDLRGKIIRIHPEPDGSYTIPEGNLFPKGLAKTRPEIYTMGHRNPFRISVDKKTGFLYWGEVGPDANEPDPKRGPRGYDEVGQARSAGNFGWPLVIANNQPYNYYDYATKTTGTVVDLAKPLNLSPNNTGLTELPPAQSAFIWYPYAESKEFPLVGTGGRNAMAGPVFYRSDFANAARPWPAYYDKKLITYDWMRGWVMAVEMDPNGNYMGMEQIMPAHKFSNPMDMQFASDGDLYMLEYGTGWFQENDDARLVRIEFNASNRKPVVMAAADKKAGVAPLAVQFSAKGSMDYDEGDQLTYEWTISPKKGGKKTVLKGENIPFTFKKKGEYVAKLTVSDGKGGTNSQTLPIVVGNEPPVLAFDLASSNQTFFFPGSKIRYEVKVADREDGSLAAGTISPDQVAINIDYLPEGYDKVAIAQGHQFSSANARFATAKAIMEKSDCNACHKAQEQSVGPMYKSIALKYKDQAEAIPMLAGRIINGSTGVWGQTAMAAHPSLSEKDAAELVKFILSYADEKAHPAPLPTKGEYATTLPEGDKGEGAYILRAAYRDRGHEGLPALDAEKMYVLRSPQLQPFDIDDYKGGQKMAFGGLKFFMPANDSYMMYKGLDLTGVVQLIVSASAPKQYNFTGGTIEMHLDRPDGLQVGKSLHVVPADATAAGSAEPSKIVLDKPISGLHDVYFVFRSDPASAGGPMMTVKGFEVQDAVSSIAPKPVVSSGTVVIQDYVGRYKFTGLPFEIMEIAIENGQLTANSTSGSGPITPTGAPNTYDAGGKALIEFVRANGKVTGMKLMPPGMSFEGIKQ